MSIWDQSVETIDREELAQLQLERLQASIFRAYRNVPFYRKRFDAMGLAPEDIAGTNDLRALPFTTRDDLRGGYPYDLLAVPLREVVRLHSSAWAGGRPVVCAFTRNDLRHWSDAAARLLTAAGVTRDDVVQIFLGHHLLTAGLVFHSGAERAGASVIPTTPTSVERQIAIMQDFRTTVLVGAPSDAAHLMEAVRDRDIDPRRLSLRVGLFGGEPWSEHLRGSIEQSLGITALDSYGLAEFGGHGLAGECAEKCGLHLAEDHVLAEIVDPESGQPVAPGETGELVLTTLTKEALPLIRFRTHDLTRLDVRPCACGRTLARIARVERRTDGQVFVQGGIGLRPTAIAGILREIEHAESRFVLRITRKGGVDEVELLVCVSDSLSVDSVGRVLAVEQSIAAQVHAATGLAVKVHLVEPQTLARVADGAVGHVVDQRAL
jgi:phenylacetate-CoA ligase